MEREVKTLAGSLLSSSSTTRRVTCVPVGPPASASMTKILSEFIRASGEDVLDHVDMLRKKGAVFTSWRKTQAADVLAGLETRV